LIDRLAEELRTDIETLAPASVIGNSKSGKLIELDEEGNGKPLTVFKQSTAAGLPVQVTTSIPIIHGPLIVEMKSTFQAHLAAVSSMDELNLFRTALLSDRKVNLTFQMTSMPCYLLSYLFIVSFVCRLQQLLTISLPIASLVQETGASYHDYDDDGEAAAGGRIAEMMRLSNACDCHEMVWRHAHGSSTVQSDQ